MKKTPLFIIIGVIGLIVVSAAGYFIYTKLNNKTEESTITIENFKFTPNELTVKKGTKITWSNKDPVTHDVTIDNGLFDHDIVSGDSFSFTFDTAGSFDYHCDIHKTMTGKIKVDFDVKRKDL